MLLNSNNFNTEYLNMGLVCKLSGHFCQGEKANVWNMSYLFWNTQGPTCCSDIWLSKAPKSLSGYFPIHSIFQSRLVHCKPKQLQSTHPSSNGSYLPANYTETCALYGIKNHLTLLTLKILPPTVTTGSFCSWAASNLIYVGSHYVGSHIWWYLRRPETMK